MQMCVKANRTLVGNVPKRDQHKVIVLSDLNCTIVSLWFPWAVIGIVSGEPLVCKCASKPTERLLEMSQ